MAKALAKARAMFTRKQFAAKITGHFNDAKKSIMAAGAALNLAKDKLDHGEFEAMIEKDLPFRPRHARTLMAIAADPWLSKRQHAAVLPLSTRAMSALVRLPDAAKEKALKSGVITPDTTEGDVKRLIKAADAATAKKDRDATPGRYFEDITDGLARLAAEIEGGDAKPARVVYADPPWKFETWSDKGIDRAPPYPTMTVEEICALPVAEVVAKDCALFLWGVNWATVEADVETAFGSFPKTVLPAAPVVMRAWGFDHVTKAFNWIKQNESGGGLHRGQGKWTRANPEDCWLATRGAPKCLSHKVDEIITGKVMEHSKKPKDAREGIEKLVRGPYLELFGRRERDGWTVLGNEIARPGGPGVVGAPVVGREKENGGGRDDEDLLEIPPYMRREA